MFLVTPLVKLFKGLFVFSWDFILTVGNWILLNRKVGHVTPEGKPGAGGKWPEYIAPKDGDSRCSCPALNALANHGIIPRDGKNLKFNEIGGFIRSTYNFAPTFCFFVPDYAANMLHRSYGKDTFDLADIDLHNGIEHDASLTREDIAFVPNQGSPHVPFVKELLDLASGQDENGKKLLTVKDLSYYLSKRRVDARASNPNYSLSRFHKIFGSTNSATMLTAFGGRISDLESFLIDERLPDGWESRIRKPFGMTFASFNVTIFKIEFGVSEKKYRAELAAKPSNNTEGTATGSEPQPEA